MKIKVQEHFPVTPKALYDAWLDSKVHSAMTGGEAHATPIEGDHFSAWDGYITGQNRSLVVNRQIVQLWRSTDFRESDPDSQITIDLEPQNDGCLLTLTHENIPDGQPDYVQGWKEHYFEPMMNYFSKQS